MNEERVRRVDRSEIVMHWAQAVPFMLLLTSGAVVLLGKYFGLSPAAAGSWGTFHRGAAVCWVTLVIFTFLTHRPEVHFANLREVLFWRPHDLHWVVSSVGSLLRLELEPPPVGKFNPGQKMNFAGVVLLAPLFLATGLVMWLHNTILLAWYAHVALAVLATLQLSGHLYMTLCHPSTRRALGGIFHGWVPRSYVEHHHPLTLDEHEPNETPWPLNRRLTIILAVLLAVGVSAAAALGGYGAFRVGLHRAGFRVLSAAVMPAPLSEAHADRKDDLSHKCLKCHDLVRAMPAGKCLSCHEPVAKRLQLKQGYHGTLTDACESCHTEHLGAHGTIISLNRREFNHDLATFHLEGRHARLGCEDCHVNAKNGTPQRMQFIGLPHESCLDCHKDPHGGQLEGRCERCHTAAGWSGQALRFAHDRDSSFRLAGKHATAKCAACHRPKQEGEPLAKARLKGLATTCAACHEDVHRGQLGTDCQRCHSEQGWRGHHLNFDHNRDTDFRLEGRHSGVDCQKCHNVDPADGRLGAARLKGLDAHCVACHEDVHRGQLGADCQRCHSVSGWKGRELHFDHNRDSRFRLTGKHATTACEKCHEPGAGQRLAAARFKELKTDCTACHRDPHADLYGQDCARCHTPRGWKGTEVLFAHNRDTRFKLTGGHLEPSCKQCHETLQRQAAAGRQYIGGPQGDCGICHADPHKGALGDTCVTCHSALGWKGRQLLFSHNRDSRFKIDALHARVACAECHQDRRYKPLETTCESCHAPYADALAGVWEGEHGAADAHDGRVKCTDCHEMTLPTQRAESYRDRCARCHLDAYRVLFDDWQELLGKQVRQASHRLDALAADGLASESVAAYRRELRSLQRIGAHNFRLARKLLAGLAARLDGVSGDPAN